MYTNYNKIRPLAKSQIDGWFYLGNGMYGVYGVTPRGVNIDIYKDKSMKDLVSARRNIASLDINSVPLTAKDAKNLKVFAEHMIA